MPRSTAAQLKSLVRKLSAERAEHAAAIETIDQTLAEFGIKPTQQRKRRRRRRKSGKKLGRPKGSKNNKQSKKAGRKKSPKKQPAKKVEPLKRIERSPRQEGVE